GGTSASSRQLEITIAAAVCGRRVRRCVATTRRARRAIQDRFAGDVVASAAADFAAAVSVAARGRAVSAVRRGVVAGHGVAAAAAAIDLGRAAFPGRAAAVHRTAAGLNLLRGCRTARAGLRTSRFRDRLLTHQPPRQQEAQDERDDDGSEPSIDAFARRCFGRSVHGTKVMGRGWKVVSTSLAVFWQKSCRRAKARLLRPKERRSRIPSPTETRADAAGGFIAAEGGTDGDAGLVV